MELGPVVRYMSDSIKQLGGDLSSHNIYCRRCTNRQAGGFDPEYGIRICANEMKDQGHLEDTMAHEMVHAYDHLRFKVNWTDNLRHAACTEVSVLCPHSSNGLVGSGVFCSLLTRAIDPGQFPQRRMSMGARVFPARTVEIHPTASGVCATTGDLVGTGATDLQGRGACDQGGERGLGQLFPGHAAI